MARLSPREFPGVSKWKAAQAPSIWMTLAERSTRRPVVARLMLAMSDQTLPSAPAEEQFTLVRSRVKSLRKAAVETWYSYRVRRKRRCRPGAAAFMWTSAREKSRLRLGAV